MNHFKHNSTKFLLAVFLLCILFANKASAYYTYPSLGIKLVTSGNGLAVAPAFTARYSFRQVDFDLGANLQLRGMRFTGYQGNMTIYVSPPTRKVRLGFFIGARYFNSASLKNNVAAQEKWKQPEADVNFDELKVRCIEGQAGFGVRIHHTWRISSFYGVGFGAYQTLGNAATFEGMHRQVNQAELTMNFALSYSLR